MASRGILLRSRNRILHAKFSSLSLLGRIATFPKNYVVLSAPLMVLSLPIRGPKCGLLMQLLLVLLH